MSLETKNQHEDRNRNKRRNGDHDHDQGRDEVVLPSVFPQCGDDAKEESQRNRDDHRDQVDVDRRRQTMSDDVHRRSAGSDSGRRTPVPLGEDARQPCGVLGNDRFLVEVRHHAIRRLIDQKGVAIA